VHHLVVFLRHNEGMLSVLLLLCSLQDAEIPVTLGLKEALRDWSGRPRTILVDGTCPLPDEFTLRVDLLWNKDEVEDDGALAPLEYGGQVRAVEVRDGKFQASLLMMGYGTYRAEVSIPWKSDQPPLTAAQKKALARRDKWTFDVAVWDAGLPERWSTKVANLRNLIASIRSHVSSLEAATATEDLWLEKKDALMSAGRELAFRAMDKESEALILPATQDYLQFVTRALDKAAVSFIFRDGKLVGPGGPRKGLGFGRNAGGVWWDSLREAMDEASKIAGREASLWCVRLLRATSEKDWPAIRKSLAKVKDLPELDNLRTCAHADLDAIEKRLRAATLELRK